MYYFIIIISYNKNTQLSRYFFLPIIMDIRTILYLFSNDAYNEIEAFYYEKCLHIANDILLHKSQPHIFVFIAYILLNVSTTETMVST